MKRDDQMRVEERVERHVIKPSHPSYDLILDFCHKSKNLYNHGNYFVRQTFIKDDKWLRYANLDKLLKADMEHPDYREMPTAQSAQQTLRMLDGAWKSFFAAVKDWSGHKDKYLGRPKLPKYLKKDGFYCLIMTNQNCKLKDGVIQFPKAFNGFTMRPKFPSHVGFLSFQQVRFVPRKSYITAELVYRIEVPDERPDNGRYIGIDIGVNNLAAVVNSWNGQPFLINGRPLKSINQYMNKEYARYKSVLEMMNGRRSSNRLRKLLSKRDSKMNDYMHKASRYIIEYCLENGVSKIIIGKNRLWKQDLNEQDKRKHPGMGVRTRKRNHQNFVQVPFDRFIRMISYKAREQGIAVVLTEEGYTSGTSFIDQEEPVKRNYDKGRRVKRDLFISNAGIEVNADINAAFQIMRKVVPITWDRGRVLRPVMVSMA